MKIFQNVYFDNTIAISGFGNYGNANSKLTQLSSVDAAKGDAAMTNMPDLDWNTAENPNGVWFTGYNGQYPTLLKKAAQAVASGTNIDWELLGTNIVYADDGSFALNFHYEPSYDSDVKLYVANAQNENKTKIKAFLNIFLFFYKINSAAEITAAENTAKTKNYSTKPD